MFYSATATGTCTCTCADYISVTSTGSCFILIGNGYFLPPAESQKLLVKTDENDSAEQKDKRQETGFRLYLVATTGILAIQNIQLEPSWIHVRDVLVVGCERARRRRRRIDPWLQEGQATEGLTLRFRHLPDLPTSRQCFEETNIHHEARNRRPPCRPCGRLQYGYDLLRGKEEGPCTKEGRSCSQEGCPCS